jgi:hypothetical protein
VATRRARDVEQLARDVQDTTGVGEPLPRLLPLVLIANQDPIGGTVVLHDGRGRILTAAEFARLAKGARRFYRGTPAAAIDAHNEEATAAAAPRPGIDG